MKAAPLPVSSLLPLNPDISSESAIFCATAQFCSKVSGSDITVTVYNLDPEVSSVTRIALVTIVPTSKVLRPLVLLLVLLSADALQF